MIVHTGLVDQLGHTRRRFERGGSVIEIPRCGPGAASPPHLARRKRILERFQLSKPPRKTPATELVPIRTRSDAMQPEDYMSFLVRLWRDPACIDQPSDWRGEIELIQTGTRWNFSTHNELLAFLHQLTATTHAAIQPAMDQTSI
jgi:hypothetical protein